MTFPSQQTKLIKMVCQRAHLMRVPFRQSPWTSHPSTRIEKKKTTTTKKQSVSVKKTSEQLRSLKGSEIQFHKNEVVQSASMSTHKKYIQHLLKIFFL